MNTDENSSERGSGFDSEEARREAEEDLEKLSALPPEELGEGTASKVDEAFDRILSGEPQFEVMDDSKVDLPLPPEEPVTEEDAQEQGAELPVQQEPEPFAEEPKEEGAGLPVSEEAGEASEGVTIEVGKLEEMLEAARETEGPAEETEHVPMPEAESAAEREGVHINRVDDFFKDYMSLLGYNEDMVAAKLTDSAYTNFRVGVINTASHEELGNPFDFDTETHTFDRKKLETAVQDNYEKLFSEEKLIPEAKTEEGLQKALERFNERVPFAIEYLRDKIDSYGEGIRSFFGKKTDEGYFFNKDAVKIAIDQVDWIIPVDKIHSYLALKLGKFVDAGDLNALADDLKNNKDEYVAFTREGVEFFDANDLREKHFEFARHMDRAEDSRRHAEEIEKQTGAHELPFIDQNDEVIKINAARENAKQVFHAAGIHHPSDDMVHELEKQTIYDADETTSFRATPELKELAKGIAARHGFEIPAPIKPAEERVKADLEERMHANMQTYHVGGTKAETIIKQNILEKIGYKLNDFINPDLIEQMVALYSNTKDVMSDYSVVGADAEDRIIRIALEKLEDKPYDPKDTNIIQQAVVAFKAEKEAKQPEEQVGGAPMQEPEPGKRPDEKHEMKFYNPKLSFKQYLGMAGVAAGTVVVLAAIAYALLGDKISKYIGDWAGSGIEAAVSEHAKDAVKPELDELKSMVAAGAGKDKELEQKLEEIAKGQTALTQTVASNYGEASKQAAAMWKRIGESDKADKERHDALEGTITSNYDETNKLITAVLGKIDALSGTVTSNYDETSRQIAGVSETVTSHYAETSPQLADLWKAVGAVDGRVNVIIEGLRLSAELRGEEPEKGELPVGPKPPENGEEKQPGYEKPKVEPENDEQTPGVGPEPKPENEEATVPGLEKKIEEPYEFVPKGGIQVREFTLSTGFYKGEANDVREFAPRFAGKLRVGDEKIQLTGGVDSHAGYWTGKINGNNNVTNYTLGLGGTAKSAELESEITGDVNYLWQTQDNDMRDGAKGISSSELGTLKGWEANVNFKTPVYNLRCVFDGHYGTAKGKTDATTHTSTVTVKDRIDTEVTEWEIKPGVMLTDFGKEGAALYARLIMGGSSMEKEDIRYKREWTGVGLRVEAPLYKQLTFFGEVEAVHCRRDVHGILEKADNDVEIKGKAGIQLRLW